MKKAWRLLLSFTPGEWQAFVAGVRSGEFELVGKDEFESRRRWVVLAGA